MLSEENFVQEDIEGYLQKNSDDLLIFFDFLGNILSIPYRNMRKFPMMENRKKKGHFEKFGKGRKLQK